MIRQDAINSFTHLHPTFSPQNGELLYFDFLRPSNFHAHLRQKELQSAIAKHIMKHMFYLLVMPNDGPIATMEQAMERYKQLIEIAQKEGFNQLQLLMTLYDTPAITPAVIEDIARSNIVFAVKHYPPHPGITTGSGHGRPLEESDRMLKAMEACNVPLLGHFEATHDEHNRLLPPEQREGYYVDHKLWRLREKYPNLRTCCEHASTKKMVEFVQADTSGRTGMTVTPHHPLMHNRTFKRSWASLAKCAPVLKGPEDQDAILEFVTSGDTRAWAGDDTAAHLFETKNRAFDDCANGCWIPADLSIALYALAFMNEGALDDRFARFMSLNGPEWWGLKTPAEDNLIRVHRTVKGDVPSPIPVDAENDIVVPLGWSKDRTDRLHIGLRCY